MVRRRRRFAAAWVSLALFLDIRAVAADPAAECQPLQAASKPVTRTTDIPYGQGLLFEVSRNGTEPSYIFGTMHVGDPDVVALPREVTVAFERSRRLVLEVRLDAGSATELSQSMFSRSGASLQQDLAPKLFGELQALLQAYDIPRSMVARLQPWAAFLTLSIPPQHKQTPLDLLLMQWAERDHRPVLGLESIREQTTVFSELSLNDQLRLLEDAICHHGTLVQELREAKAAYRHRQLDRLLALSIRYVQDGAPMQRLLDRLLWSRNTVMAARLAPILDQGRAFIAIGALHLAGDRGVLALLRAQRFEVQRRY